jgi:hypothetical protein
VVLSVGPNNYGHPTATALNLYKSVGAAVWRTDQMGTVTITVQASGAYTITTEKGRAAQGQAVGSNTSPPPRPVPTLPSAPTPVAPSSVSYANCAAVRAAGKSPLLRGQPGYSTKLDRDGDGRACE